MLPKPQKDPDRASSYRPISLLSTISKLFERVVLDRLLSWLNSNDILSKYQAGFRKQKQTKDHIFRIIQDVLASFNSGYKTGAVFIDIEKAFDKVWHAGLLYKLNKLKVPCYLGEWIANYLENRTFSVRYNGSMSERTSMQTGVPQGSVLGPILFNIFFNDIVETKTGVELALFADDVAFWTRSHSLQSIERKLQHQQDALATWSAKWRTKISDTKTSFLVFNKHNRLQTKCIKLFHNGRQIKAERNPKFLGLTLDPAMTLNKHAEIIATRAMRRINMLRRIKGLDWGASSKLAMTTYKVLIRPIIDYVPFATIVTSKSTQLKLERVQRAAIRVASNWPSHTSAAAIYQQLSMKPVVERAYELATNYLKKALINNSIIRETTNRYTRIGRREDGASWKKNNRPSLLGLMCR